MIVALLEPEALKPEKTPSPMKTVRLQQQRSSPSLAPKHLHCESIEVAEASLLLSGLGFRAYPECPSSIYDPGRYPTSPHGIPPHPPTPVCNSRRFRELGSSLRCEHWPIIVGCIGPVGVMHGNLGAGMQS